MALDDSARLIAGTPEQRVAPVIGALWRQGLNSLEIAISLHEHEYIIVQILHALRNERRACAVENGADIGKHGEIA